MKEILKPLVRRFVSEIRPLGMSDVMVDKITLELEHKITMMPLLMRTALYLLTSMHVCGMDFLPPVKEVLRFYRKMVCFIYYSVLGEGAACEISP